MDKAIIVGTVSNVSRTIERDLKRALESCSRFDVQSIYLVESDSTDNTRVVLKKMAYEISNFDYVSLGDLRFSINNRIDRIRFCRNVYVDKIRSFEDVEDIDFVVVIDLDGINKKLNAKSVDSCFIRNDWDVVLPNQQGGYYDVLALRCKNWQEVDCFQELGNFRDSHPFLENKRNHFFNYISAYIHFDYSRKKFVYDKMKKIKKSDPWILVESGFGGIAIYKATLFNRFDYGLMSKTDPRYGESEHVTINQAITKSGAKIFINPKFINGNFNTYNINRYFLIRLARFGYRDAKKCFKILKGSLL